MESYFIKKITGDIKWNKYNRNKSVTNKTTSTNNAELRVYIEIQVICNSGKSLTQNKNI